MRIKLLICLSIKTSTNIIIKYLSPSSLRIEKSSQDNYRFG